MIVAKNNGYNVPILKSWNNVRFRGRNGFIGADENDGRRRGRGGDGVSDEGFECCGNL
jgi:hypothetical protein